MPTFQAVITSWPISKTAADMVEFLRRTPLKFAELAPIDDLLDGLQTRRLAAIEYGRTLPGGHYGTVFRIELADDPGGTTFALHQTQPGADIEPVYFESTQRDQLKVRIEQIVASYEPLTPAVAGGREVHIDYDDAHDHSPQLFAVAYPRADDRRRSPLVTRPGGSRREDRERRILN